MSNPFEKNTGEQIENSPTMEELFNAWKATWVSELHGPQFIRESVFTELSPESQEAETPEREAYQRLVDGVAKQVREAAADGKHREVINAMTQMLGATLTGIMFQQVAANLLKDIWARSLDKN